MQITTFEKSYYIKNVIGKNDVSSNYICNDLRNNDEKDYLLVQLHPEKCPEFIKLIIGMKKENWYVDCFSDKGSFYAVFMYCKQKTLKEKMDTINFSIIEKAEIAKSFFEKIILTDAAKDIINEMIDPENITLDDALCIEFNYCIHNAQLCEFSDVEEKMSAVIRTVFSKVEYKPVSDSLDSFCTCLDSGKFHSVMEIYRAYLIIYEEIKKQADQNTFAEDKRIIIIRKITGKVIRISKHIFYWAIVAAAFFLLIYTASRPHEDKPNTYYDQIGDVKINEYKETTAVTAPDKVETVQ